MKEIMDIFVIIFIMFYLDVEFIKLHIRKSYLDVYMLTHIHIKYFYKNLIVM